MGRKGVGGINLPLLVMGPPPLEAVGYLLVASSGYVKWLMEKCVREGVEERGGKVLAPKFLG